MPIKKGIKISSTKRGHHESHKKNFVKSKKQLNREKQKKTNIFQKSKTAMRKEELKQKGIQTPTTVVPAKKQKPKNRKKNPQNIADKDRELKFGGFAGLGAVSSDEDDEEVQASISKRPRLDSTSDGSNESFSEAEESDDEMELEEIAENMEIAQRRAGAMEAGEVKKMKELLPIKTRTGVVPRMTEDYKKKVQIAEDEIESEQEDEEDSDDKDSDDEILKDTTSSSNQNQKKKKMSAMELILEREEEVQRQKFRIGVISSGILEKPEEKVKNLGALLGLMADNPDNLLSIRKLAMISLGEVFKDIVPDYKVGVVDLEQQKVRKETLARVAYENELLRNYKNYLRELEHLTKVLKPRKYGPRPSREQIALAEVAIQCLCDALLSQPYFNFGTNIGQLLVGFLNCHNFNVRKKTNETLVKFFKTDKRLDLTRHIVRNINQLVKKKSNYVCVEVISCLTALQIKTINVDAEKEAELKQKKLEQHKSRLISMSKRERKRKKKLADLEKEMMETQAEENKQSRNSKLTDIAKLVFTIYFRVLKQNPNSRLLSSTLEGLAMFAHIINIEFFSDLIEVLNHLIENVDLGYREQLHCIQTVFTILSGQGEVLNIDPARFYTHLYKNILQVQAGKNHNDVESILTTLENVLIRRRKSITHLRYLAFLKRLMSLSLQVHHNGSLGCLAIVKNAMQLNSNLDILLDTENKVGSGKFDPAIIEPEFSNANCTSLFELSLLRRHYHPTVVKFANHIAGGVQINSGLEPALSKLTPMELYTQFDSSQMAFNPSIPPPPKGSKFKTPFGKHNFKLKDIEDLCSRKRKFEETTFDFHAEF